MKTIDGVKLEDLDENPWTICGNEFIQCRNLNVRDFGKDGSSILWEYGDRFSDDEYSGLIATENTFSTEAVAKYHKMITEAEPTK